MSEERTEERGREREKPYEQRTGIQWLCVLNVRLNGCERRDDSFNCNYQSPPGGGHK